MALGFNKNRDTLEVFNDRWKSNHNYGTINEEIQKQNNFNKKLYGMKTIEEKNTVSSPQDKINTLNNRINYNDNINRSSKINSIKNNFGK